MTAKDYDLFERMIDGRFKWVGMARGLIAVNRRLDQLARASGTDCVAYDFQADRVVGTRGPAAESSPSWIHLVKRESRRLHTARHSVREVGFRKTLRARGS